MVLSLPPQGAEPEEADLPADSLLRPLRPTRVYLGDSQKACLLNTPPALPDRLTRRLNEIALRGLHRLIEYF